MARSKAINAIGRKMEQLKHKRAYNHVVRFKNELHRLNHIRPEEMELGEIIYDSATDTYTIDLRTNIPLTALAMPKGFVEASGEILGQESFLNKLNGKSKIKFEVKPLALSTSIPTPDPQPDTDSNNTIDDPDDKKDTTKKADSPKQTKTFNKKITLEMLNAAGVLNDKNFLELFVEELKQKLDEMEKNNKQASSEYNACNLLVSNLEHRIDLMNRLIANKNKFKTFLEDYQENKAHFKDVDDIRIEFDILMEEVKKTSYFDIKEFAVVMYSFEEAKEVTDNALNDLKNQEIVKELYEETVSILYNLVTTEDQDKYLDYLKEIIKQNQNIFGTQPVQPSNNPTHQPGMGTNPNPPSGPSNPVNPPSGPSNPINPPSGPSNPVNPPSGPSNPINPSSGPSNPVNPPSGPSNPVNPPSGSSNPVNPPSGATPSQNNSVLTNYLETLKLIKNMTTQMIQMEMDLYQKEISAISVGLTNDLENMVRLNADIEKLNQRIMNLQMKLSDIEYSEFINNNYCIINEPIVIQTKLEMSKEINSCKDKLFGNDVEQRFANKNQIINEAIKILESKTDPKDRTKIITFIKNVHDSKCRFANNLITFVDKNGKEYDSIDILTRYNINLSSVAMDGPVIQQAATPVLGGSDIIQPTVQAPVGHDIIQPRELDSSVELTTEEMQALLNVTSNINEELEQHKIEAMKIVEEASYVNKAYFIEQIGQAKTIDEICRLLNQVDFIEKKGKEETQQLSVINSEEVSIEKTETTLPEEVQASVVEETITDVEVSTESKKSREQLKVAAELGFAKDMAIMKIRRLELINNIEQCIDRVNACVSEVEVENVLREILITEKVEEERKQQAIAAKAAQKTEEVQDKQKEEVQDNQKEEVQDNQKEEVQDNQIEEPQQEAEVGEMSFDEIEQALGISLEQKTEEVQDNQKEEVQDNQKEQSQETKTVEKIKYVIKDVKLKTLDEKIVHQVNVPKAIIAENVDKIKIERIGQNVKINFTRSIIEKLNDMKVNLKRIESAKGTKIYGAKDVPREKVEGLEDRIRLYYEQDGQEGVIDLDYGEESSGLRM